MSANSELSRPQMDYAEGPVWPALLACKVCNMWFGLWVSSSCLLLWGLIRHTESQAQPQTCSIPQSPYFHQLFKHEHMKAEEVL